ncbi:MAG TPA: methylated-DNA--[protein]-cysteine S-methyltransferase [Steroidobacteraceae bacterium]|nr:methylated-DNA--[protein]-cysteine S-methyltransferase [Steroidobacteraceae bacterium]
MSSVERIRRPRARIDWPRTLLAACRRLERADTAPALGMLASDLGVSPEELQRQFRRRLGTTPKAYGQAIALNRLARLSSRAPSALEATLEAGFDSPSAAYALARRSFGEPPGRLRAAERIGWWMGLSDLGWMLMAATERGICSLAFGARPGELLEELRADFPGAALESDEERLRGWFDAVRDFILLPQEALDLPLDVQGTAFQSRVWRALRKVPLGSTVSYGAMARRIGAPTAARAVASACGSNRIALLIPCHRVVGVGGEPGGYRWGKDRKRTLLAREAAKLRPVSR